MAWKRQWLSGRFVEGNRSIIVIALEPRVGAGIIVFYDGFVVVAPYEQGRVGSGAEYSVSDNGFARIVPIPAAGLSPKEAQPYIEMFSDAIRDVEGAAVDVKRREPPTSS
jgi:hypothetical protein